MQYFVYRTLKCAVLQSICTCVAILQNLVVTMQECFHFALAVSKLDVWPLWLVLSIGSW